MLLSQIENKARDYGLSRLSKASGITRPHIHKILNGKISPSLRTITKLLAILGCDLEIIESPRRQLDLANQQALKYAMAYYGAPLILESGAREQFREMSIPSFETTLIAALNKGRSSAEINTVLPTLIHKNLQKLNWENLIESFEDRQYLGYLLQLLYNLTGDRKYAMASSKLDIDDTKLRTKFLIKDGTRNKYQTAFFAKVNNPAARTWKLQTGDSWESIQQRFNKWCGNDLQQTGA